MLLYHSPAAPVHSNNSAPASRVMADDEFRAWKSRQAAEFAPTPEDDAFRLAYELASAGGPGRLPSGPGLTPEVALRWARGTAIGKADRDRAEARALGFAQGLDSGITVPPAGYSADERAAWLEGNEDGRVAAEARDEVMSEWAEAAWDRNEVVAARGCLVAARMGGVR